MKAKVIANAKKQKQRKKERHKDFRAERYNKIRKFKFPDKDDVNMEKNNG